MATTITFQHPTVILGRQNGIDGSFDAMLDMTTRNNLDNADLTIYMRIHLYDATTNSKIVKNGMAKDADGNSFKAYPWPDADFKAWKKKLISQAQECWHGKFWLQTPDKYAGLDWPAAPQKRTHRPNVWCRFELSAAQSKQGAHFSIGCVNLGKASEGGSSQFRSHSFLYDSNDPLNTKLHEVGHLLGLDHPSGKGNHAAAYKDRPGFPDDVMGKGTKVHLHHASPWQTAIGHITSTQGGDWYVARNKIAPRVLK